MVFTRSGALTTGPVAEASAISRSISTEPGQVFDALISRCMMMWSRSSGIFQWQVTQRYAIEPVQSSRWPAVPSKDEPGTRYELTLATYLRDACRKLKLACRTKHDQSLYTRTWALVKTGAPCVFLIPCARDDIV